MDRFCSVDEAYRHACHELLINGHKVGGTKELTNYSFQLTDIDKNIVNIRNISKSYLLGEMLWYASGRNDVDFISHFAKLWSRISDDHVTSNSAYGYIMLTKHGFNQIEKIIKLLNTDRDTRRAVININVPNEHVIETKDEPCTIALDFMIRDGKLCCTCMMRSNDIWYGLPYDVAFFTELQKYIAQRVNAEYGTYTHFAVSLHVYDRNLHDIEEVIDRKASSRIRVDYMKLMKYKYSLIDYLQYYAYDWKSALVQACFESEIIKEEKV